METVEPFEMMSTRDMINQKSGIFGSKFAIDTDELVHVLNRDFFTRDLIEKAVMQS